MARLNVWAYGLQRIFDASEPHYQKKNHKNERLTLFTGETSTSYPSEGTRVVGVPRIAWTLQQRRTLHEEVVDLDMKHSSLGRD